MKQEGSMEPEAEGQEQPDNLKEEEMLDLMTDKHETETVFCQFSWATKESRNKPRDKKQSVKRAPLKMPFSCYNKFSILENYEMSSNYEKINAEENLSMKQQKVDHTSQNKKRSHFRNN